MNKAIGGERLGSGNKMNVSLHNFERSSHDLSEVFRSSMNVGTLVPFLNKVALPGDTWDINLNTLIRTEPTQAPLFGSFKFQADVFVIPLRLYNAALHMNMLGIGNRMQEAFLPLVEVLGNSQAKWKSDCLMSYLGWRGMPTIKKVQSPATVIKQAVPLLGYYEIFKQYFANKQEENAYVIAPDEKGTVGFAIIQTTAQSGTSTYSVTNTTPPYGKVSAPIGTGYTKILLGGDEISDNQINDVYLRIANSDGIFDVRISIIGKCTEKGVNDIEVELTNINKIGRAHV